MCEALLLIVAMYFVIVLLPLTKPFSLPLTLSLAYFRLITRSNWMLEHAPHLRMFLYSLILAIAVAVLTMFIVCSIKTFRDARRNRSKQPGASNIVSCEQRLLACSTPLLLVLIILLSSGATAALITLSPVKAGVNEFLSTLQPLVEEGAYDKVVDKIVEFVDASLKNSYGSLKHSFYEIDNMLTGTDYDLLGILGFTRAHMILFQGWGSCGQYAIVTEHLLSSLGLQTRHARFKNSDHEWAEIKLNNTWYIVDPWYIGHYFNHTTLAPAKLLVTQPPFNHYKGVTVTYPNGTTVDASKEHGYNK